MAAGDALLGAVRARHAEVLATRPVFVPVSDAWVRLCEAEAARLHRDPDPAAWVASVRAWDAIRRPYLAAYSRWREAEARLAARGGRDEATAALRGALDVANRLGAEPLAREITALAARARLSLDVEQTEEPSAVVSPVDDDVERFGLTAREREVLGLVALGRTNRQIAGELFISENTAGVHVSRILGKLEVASRGEAAAIAYRLGMVEPVRETA
jgi:DNA-binding CsgD family transcriptional regulator